MVKRFNSPSLTTFLRRKRSHESLKWQSGSIALEVRVEKMCIHEKKRKWRTTEQWQKGMWFHEGRQTGKRLKKMWDNEERCKETLVHGWSPTREAKTEHRFREIDKWKIHDRKELFNPVADRAPAVSSSDGHSGRPDSQVAALHPLKPAPKEKGVERTSPSNAGIKHPTNT